VPQVDCIVDMTCTGSFYGRRILISGRPPEERKGAIPLGNSGKGSRINESPRRGIKLQRHAVARRSRCCLDAELTSDPGSASFLRP
jgi:hypothetical protein